MLGNLLGGFVVILLGVTLIPTIADTVYDARYINTTGGSGNDGTLVTGTAGTVMGLTTVFYSLGIMSAGVALAMNGLRSAGVMN